MYTMNFAFNGLSKTDAQLNHAVVDAEKRIKQKMTSLAGYGEERCARAQLVKLFNKYDKGEVPGKLTLAEFTRCLSENTMAGMDDVLTALFHRYDTDDSGLLDYSEFTKGLYGIVPVPAASEECRELCQRISRKLTAQGGGGNRALVLSLRSMDHDGNRVLSPKELEAGFRKHGIELTPDEWNIVSKYFDRNRDGTISIEEVCHTIRGDMSQWRTQLVKFAFKHIDADGSGSISFSELAAAYRADLHPDVQAGRLSEHDCLVQFIDSWVKDPGETIEEMEFIDYYKDISGSLESDDEFLSLLKNTWRVRPGEEKLPVTSRHVELEVTSTGGVCEVTHLPVKAFPDPNAISNQQAELQLRKAGWTDIRKVRVLGVV